MRPEKIFSSFFTLSFTRCHYLCYYCYYYCYYCLSCIRFLYKIYSVNNNTKKNHLFPHLNPSFLVFFVFTITIITITIITIITITIITIITTITIIIIILLLLYYFIKYGTKYIYKKKMNRCFLKRKSKST